MLTQLTPVTYSTRPHTLVVGYSCQVKCPCPVLRLSEVDQVFHPVGHHLLYLRRVPFMDGLQQTVDLEDLQAALCRLAPHSKVEQKFEVVRKRKKKQEKGASSYML